MDQEKKALLLSPCGLWSPYRVAVDGGEHMAMGRVLGGLARRRDGGRSSLREEMARGMVEWTDSM